jgi:hypothetical protein
VLFVNKDSFIYLLAKLMPFISCSCLIIMLATAFRTMLNESEEIGHAF